MCILKDVHAPRTPPLQPTAYSHSDESVVLPCLAVPWSCSLNPEVVDTERTPWYGLEVCEHQIQYMASGETMVCEHQIQYNTVYNTAQTTHCLVRMQSTCPTLCFCCPCMVYATNATLCFCCPCMVYATNATLCFCCPCMVYATNVSYTLFLLAPHGVRVG